MTRKGLICRITTNQPTNQPTNKTDIWKWNKEMNDSCTHMVEKSEIASALYIYSVNRSPFKTIKKIQYFFSNLTNCQRSSNAKLQKLLARKKVWFQTEPIWFRWADWSIYLSESILFISRSLLISIYLSISFLMSRMIRQVNFQAVYCWFEFGVFHLLDWFLHPDERAQPILLFTHYERRALGLKDRLMPIPGT